jgi:hypothetical protein
MINSNKILAIEPPLQADLLVSVKNGRPKNKTVTIYTTSIVISPGTRTRTTWSINANHLVLVTRRKTANQTATLTVFFVCSKSSMGQVESIEMGFDGLEQLNIWHTRLMKLGPGYMSPRLPVEPLLPSQDNVEASSTSFLKDGTTEPGSE